MSRTRLSQEVSCPKEDSLNLSFYSFPRLAHCSAFVAILLLAATSAWGQGKVLYSFTGGADGGYPLGGLVRDSSGNLYGVTSGGGDTSPEQCQPTSGCGVVFELSPNGSGGWKEAVLHTFTGGTDGLEPLGNLVFDGSGNLYGTTEYGGNGCEGFYGCGTVYELSPAGGGVWTENIIHTFTSGPDGYAPWAGLVFDNAGNLYGTTRFGVNSACNTLGCGAVFELSPSGGGTWSEQFLYVFQDAADGAEPMAGVTFDASGNLYGTAGIGGDTTGCNPPYGCGTIYELSPGTGGWTQSVLYTFDGANGNFPNSGLAIDARGDLYGNMYNYVYRMTPQEGGGFNLTNLHTFNVTDGDAAEATPLIDGGILYGTVESGGGDNRDCTAGCGGIYRLKPTGSGVTFSFLGFGTANKGEAPEGSLISDSAGNLYGTTSRGGADGAGTVFEVTP